MHVCRCVWTGNNVSARMFKCKRKFVDEASSHALLELGTLFRRGVTPCHPGVAVPCVFLFKVSAVVGEGCLVGGVGIGCVANVMAEGADNSHMHVLLVQPYVQNLRHTHAYGTHSRARSLVLNSAH